MIEASFAAQYGIRLRIEPDITVGEFVRLLAGLMPDTPLGRVVAIRSENEPARVRSFSANERRIRTQWQRGQCAKRRGQADADWETQIAALQRTLSAAFCGTATD